MLGIAESVIGVAGKVLDKFVEDKDLKTKLSHELKSQIVSLDLAQAQTNLEQAKHPSIFVAGARPAITWICAFGLGWQLARGQNEEKPPPWLRGGGVLLFVLGLGTLLWLSPPRLIEANQALRLERSSELLEHRYVTYYNLGIGTVWAEMVEDVNDMIDYRAAEGRPEAFHGFQAGLWGSGRRLALGEGETFFAYGIILLC